MMVREYSLKKPYAKVFSDGKFVQGYKFADIGRMEVSMKKKSKFARYSLQDKALLTVGYILLGLFVVAIIVPMIYIIVASFIYSVVFTFVSVLITMLAAYPMSRPDFRGKKFFNVIFVITMFFGGGLIPTYLLISDMGLKNSMWAIILPGAFSVWNMIIARTYYQGIPGELREAADVDGANELTFFFKILLPVCTPIIATLSLWQFVGMWNSYFDAMIYLDESSKQPLQLVLRAILIQSKPDEGMISDMQSTAERAQLSELLKYATIIISSLPLLVMYPFFQKYFDSGIMAGSVKG